jgi:hypothetical protein
MALKLSSNGGERGKALERAREKTPFYRDPQIQPFFCPPAHDQYNRSREWYYLSCVTVTVLPTCVTL